MSREYVKALTEYHSIFQNNVLPILQKEELKRQKEKKVLELCKYLIVALVVVLLIGVYKLSLYFSTDISMFYNSMWYLISLPIIVILSYFISSRVNKYKLHVKSLCINEYLKIFGDLKWFDKNDFVPAEYIEYSGLVPKFNYETMDESYWGEYKNIEVAIAEKKLYSITERNKSSGMMWCRSKVFEGCFITFKVNKNIKNRTIVTNKKNRIIKNMYLSLGYIAVLVVYFAPLLFVVPHGWKIAWTLFFIIVVGVGAYSVRSKIKNFGENLQRMKLEDLKFNDMFVSYSSSQVEGRYLVTPAFMERLMNLNFAFKAKSISASFFDDKLMIAIETDKDLFEIGDLWHPLTNIKYANDFYNEMHSILSMIEYFKLDEKTGL